MPNLAEAWLMATCALIGAGALLYYRATRPGIVVLLFHRLLPEAEWEKLQGSERNFCCSVERFEAHITALQRAGYRFISTSSLSQRIQRPLDTRERLAVITFDDGSESVYQYALPIVSKLNIPATVFITPDPNAWVHEHQPLMTRDQLNALRNAGFEFGGHGMSHNGLVGMSDTQLSYELGTGKETLEHLGQAPVRDLALPLGFYDSRVLQSARLHGYRMVFTANPGRADQHTNPYAVPRIAVEGQLHPDAFPALLSPRQLMTRQVLSWLKRLPPRLLGETRWMPLRERLFGSPVGSYLHGEALIFGMKLCVLTWMGLTIWAAVTLLS